LESPARYSIGDTPVFPEDFLQRGRIPQLIKAVKILKREMGNQVPIVGGIIGPFTLAGYLLEVVSLLNATFNYPDRIRPFLEVAEKAGTKLAKALIDAGADIIACTDMMASPEMIMVSPSMYRDYALKYQRKQFKAIHVPKILHICGNVDTIVKYMGQTESNILCISPKTNVTLARKFIGPDMIFMGGIETTTTLFMKDPENVRRWCERSIAAGIQILAPACAIEPGTPTKNLMAMVETARENSVVFSGNEVEKEVIPGKKTSN
jgi:[methyl-Co(III) methanol-specific corrinoid protein]:coenzyme M methyltransferase